MTLPTDNIATICPVFYPSQEQFTSFSSYIREEIEPKCSHIGICKVHKNPADGMHSIKRTLFL